MARYKQRKNDDDDDNNNHHGGNNRHDGCGGGGGSSNRPCFDTGPGMSPIEASRRIRELEAENRTLRATSTSTCQTEEERLRAACAVKDSIIQERDDMIDGQTVIIKQQKKEIKRLKKMEEDDDDDDDELDSRASSNNKKKKQSIEKDNTNKRRKTNKKEGNAAAAAGAVATAARETIDLTNNNDDIDDNNDSDGDGGGDDGGDDSDGSYNEGDNVGHVRNTKSPKNRRAASTGRKKSNAAAAGVSASGASSATAPPPPAPAAAATAANPNDNNDRVNEIKKIIDPEDKIKPATGKMIEGKDLKQALKYLGMKHYKLSGHAAKQFVYGPHGKSQDGIGYNRFHTMRNCTKSWPKFEKRFLSVTYESLFEQKTELAKQLYESDHFKFATPHLSEWIEDHGGVVDA